MRLRPIKLWLFLTMLTLSRSPAWAVPLQFTANNLGGGLFQYDLTLNNQFSEPVSGLNLFHGFSVFGLDDTSVISAPAGWDFFAPLPPLVDELNFFSLSTAADIPIGGSLGGFVFQSTTDPANLKPGDLAFDVIGGRSGAQLNVPENANSGMLFATSLVGLIAYDWRRWRTGKLPHDCAHGR